MSSLNELQQLFYQAIFEKGEQGPAMNALSSLVNDTDQLAASECINIYRNSVIGTFIVVLGEIFPVTKKLLGEQFFDAMCKVYVKDSTSGSPDLCDYGQDFPAFLSQFEHTVALTYLPDVASFEWMWHRAFNAIDAPGFNFNELAEVPEKNKANLVFQLAPETGMLQSNFPVLLIWESNQQESNDSETIDLDSGGVQLAIWRQQTELMVEPLSDQEWFVLKGCGRSLKFWDLCFQFDQHFPGVDPGEIIGAFLTRGLISHFDI